MPARPALSWFGIWPARIFWFPEDAPVPRPSDSLALIQGWVARLQAGDPAARDALIGAAGERLRRLARQMLQSYPRVRRWEETDDVLQNALLRLYRSLKDVPPASVVDFLRLAALNIRRELLDLVKHYYGPRGHGAHHVSLDPDQDGTPPAAGQASLDPDRLAMWSEFHQQVERLPDEERAVFDLLWYQGLSQPEAAEVLGVNERTLKRRWQSARVKLHDALHGEAPL
jgi:RNA polymerase sigma-70 factor (ECF subfamily)